MDEPEKKTAVLHVITRMIVGGAQENTLATVVGLDPQRYKIDLISGTQTGSEGSLLEEAERRGVRIKLLPFLVREISPIKDLRAFWALFAAMRRGRYDVVHTHSGKAGVLGRWAAWLARVPVVIHTVHGWSHHDHQHCLARGAYILLERITAPVTDKLIVVSPLNTEKGLKGGIGKAEKYVTIRSGIDLTAFETPSVAPDETRKGLGIPQDALIVGTVTRLSPQKAPLDFVKVAREIRKTCSGTHFVMAGDGPMREEVEKAIHDVGLTDCVHLVGLRRDIPDLLHCFDLFMLTSLWEGLPRVLPQAMAASLPIVATRADGNAEAVEDGVNGFLVDASDAEVCAEKAVSLLTNPEKRRQMGRKGYEKVSVFSEAKMVADIDHLYEQLRSSCQQHYS